MGVGKSRKLMKPLKPAEAIKSLQKMGRKAGLNKMSIQKMKKIIEEAALKEIEEEFLKRAPSGWKSTKRVLPVSRVP